MGKSRWRLFNAWKPGCDRRRRRKSLSAPAGPRNTSSPGSGSPGHSASLQHDRASGGVHWEDHLPRVAAMRYRPAVCPVLAASSCRWDGWSRVSRQERRQGRRRNRSPCLFFRTPTADENSPQMPVAPGLGHHPLAHLPRRIMPNVLGVAALEVSHPVSFVVAVEIDNAASHDHLRGSGNLQSRHRRGQHPSVNTWSASSRGPRESGASWPRYAMRARRTTGRCSEIGSGRWYSAGTDSG